MSARCLLARSVWIALLAGIAVLVAAEVAASKEIVATVCGRDRCRTVEGGISGIAVRPTRVRAPRGGRFYTIAVRVRVDGRSRGWKVVYEARRQIVLATNERTRSLLGSRWRLLAPGVRASYSRSVRGLVPMSVPPLVDAPGSG